MDILTVIPARGGSKRVPNKNMREVGGKPMLWWTINAALEAGLQPVVSSESMEILEYAATSGAIALERPLAFAADTSSTESVLIHALDAVTEQRAKWVLCLPPTSPLRTADTIRRVLDHKRPADADCIMTVTEYRGDLWWKRGAFMDRLVQGAPRRQQDREPMYEENSAAYLVRSESLWMTQSVLGYGNVIGVPISRKEALDVNDELDVVIADRLLKEPSHG